MPSPFLFGICNVADQGPSAQFDMVALPGVQAGIVSRTVEIGGMSYSIGGVGTKDRTSMRREWQVKLKPHLPVESWWPVLRMWEQYTGPFMFTDCTRPNLIRLHHRLGQRWYTSTGANTTPRGDGAIMLNAGTTVGMELFTSPSRTGLAPIIAQSMYAVAMTLYASAAFSTTVSVAWFDNTNPTPISVSTLGTFNASSGRLITILDGTIAGRRISTPVAAPAGATYAQMRITATSGSVDVIDPVILPGAADPGRSTFIVQITETPEEEHASRGYATLPLSLQSVAVDTAFLTPGTRYDGGSF